MDSSTFVQGEGLQARYLDAKLEHGLLIGADGKTTFLILAEGDARWAVMISDKKFDGWKLEPDTRHWYGIFIPNIAIMLDLQSATDERAPHGSIVVQDDTLRMSFRQQGSPFGHIVSLNSSPGKNLTPSDPYISFTNWKAGRWKKSGDFEVIFERQLED